MLYCRAKLKKTDQFEEILKKKENARYIHIKRKDKKIKTTLIGPALGKLKHHTKY